MTWKVPDAWSAVARFILYRLNRNRDAKIIITGKGAATGVGKTTAAIQTARWIHSLKECGCCGWITVPDASECPQCGSDRLSDQQDEWTTDKHAFLDPWKYIDYYTNHSSKGEALIQDESEFSIHKRRGMSGENVEMTKAWAALRFKECVSILTLPSTDMIDSMMMQLGDLWFNVMRRGTIYPHHYFYNDYTQKVRAYRITNEYGMQSEVRFGNLEDDPEFQKLTDKKEEYTGGRGVEIFDESDVESAAETAELKHRIGVTENLLAYTELNQGEIGEIVHPDEEDSMSQQWVSKVNTGDLDVQNSNSKQYPVRS